jgi:hypothetical protein
MQAHRSRNINALTHRSAVQLEKLERALILAQLDLRTTNNQLRSTELRLKPQSHEVKLIYSLLEFF